jgi:hypothetical protein
MLGSEVSLLVDAAAAQAHDLKPASVGARRVTKLLRRILL